MDNTSNVELGKAGPIANSKWQMAMYNPGKRKGGRPASCRMPVWVRIHLRFHSGSMAMF